MKKRNGLEVSAIIVRCAMAALIAFLLLGVGKCDVNDKADIIKLHPELKDVADKFDMKKLGDVIELTTYDNLSFSEAISKLKKTPMNNPVSIHLYDKKSIGELETKITVKDMAKYSELIYFYDFKQPYKGIIFISEGYWDALEIDASKFVNEKANGSIVVKEFHYVNKTVMELNNYDTNKRNYTSLLSFLDPTETGDSVKGDGSSPDTIVSEFDR
jgi:hypothetical protein